MFHKLNCETFLLRDNEKKYFVLREREKPNAWIDFKRNFAHSFVIVKSRSSSLMGDIAQAPKPFQNGEHFNYVNYEIS